MKKVLVGVLLALVALLAFNLITTGKLALIPSSPLSASAQGRDLARLEERFVAATHQYYQAGRAAGVSGIDTSSDARAAMEELNQIEKELIELKSRNPSPADLEKIEEILSNIHKVRNS